MGKEEHMGLFTRNTSVEPYSTLGNADTLPPDTSDWKSRIAAGGTAVANRATEIYRQNPKLVGGLAVLAGAAILAGMRKRGRA
jgi:hypothetical protein